LSKARRLSEKRRTFSPGSTFFLDIFLKQSEMAMSLWKARCGETVFAETIEVWSYYTECSRSKRLSKYMPRNKDNETDGDSGSQQID